MLKNSTNIPLSVAAWLAIDNYDYKVNPKYISATALLNPIKAIVLERTLPITTETDIADLVPSRLGTAVHDGIEQVWITREARNKALNALGIPENIRKNICINPSIENSTPPNIPIYLEQRSYKDIEGFTVGGKFDFVAEGVVTDFKTTKTYSYISQTNSERYIQQASIYRWLNPEIITEDYMYIAYIFTDWINVKAVQDKKYPQQAIINQKYSLMSLADTENFISSKLQQIKHFSSLPQKAMPRCTKEELWQKDSVWKYFKNPTKLARSTKNFDNPGDANQRCASDGNVGVVKEVPGEVKRCKYCNARSVCMQAEQLVFQGLL